MQERKFYREPEWVVPDHVLIYLRSDTESGIWQARIKAADGDRYITKSLKTRDQDEARENARALYDEMRFKHKHDIPIRERSFEKLYRDWLGKRKGFMKPQRHQDHLQKGENYFFRFFANHDLAQINEQVLESYWEWRVKPDVYIRNRPSSATLDHEKDSLNQFFRWAAQRGYMRRKPDIELPMKVVRNRRPTFATREYLELIRRARSWTRETEHRQSRYQRTLIYFLARFVAYSGLRPGEAIKLNWGDITLFHDAHGTLQMCISVPEETKNGRREAIPLPRAIGLLERWKRVVQERKAERLDHVANRLPEVYDDDPVFMNYVGDRQSAFERPVAKMLEYAGMKVDRNGRHRSLYSFRHLYATFRLLYGINSDPYLLAQNMGTSVEMIEKHYGHLKPRQMAHELTSTRKLKPGELQPAGKDGGGLMTLTDARETWNLLAKPPQLFEPAARHDKELQVIPRGQRPDEAIPFKNYQRQ